MAIAQYSFINAVTFARLLEWVHSKLLLAQPRHGERAFVLALASPLGDGRG
jgi:hypothetical protein